MDIAADAFVRDEGVDCRVWAPRHRALGSRGAPGPLPRAAEPDARTNIRRYYAWLGDIADIVVRGTARSRDEVKRIRDAFEGHGCGELVPASGDPARVDVLRAAL